MQQLTTPAHRLEEYRKFAVELATEAGMLASAQFKQVTARRKFDGSLVTLIDEQLDRFIADHIRAAYPTHAVLSEEQETVYRPEASHTWVVDPIDGTTNYARGLPIWGVSIALMVDGLPVVAALDFPLLHEKFSGAWRQGAFRNDSFIQSAETTLPDDESFVMTCTRSPRRYQLSSPLKARILGSAAYHLAKVADGVALACLEATPKIWDLAGAAVLLHEAGARLETIAGAAVFPVPALNQDYRQLSIPIVAAANEALLVHMRQSLTLRPA